VNLLLLAEHVNERSGIIDALLPHFRSQHLGLIGNVEVSCPGTW
jgi:hypothetical protein